MEPRIISRPAFTVVGMHYRGKNEYGEIPQMWRQFGPRIGEIKHQVKHGVAYGVMGNYDHSMGEFDYVAGVEVDSVADIPEGMVSWEIPEQTYAVFSFPFAALREAYQYAYKTWLPVSDYQYADGPEFEFYPEEFNPDDENSKMALYVPIK